MRRKHKTLIRLNMFSANHPYFNICFNIELPMKNGADIECGVGREREGEREREREK